MFYQGEFRKCSGEAFFFFVLQFDFCLLNDFDFSRLYQHGVLLIVFTAILESVTFSSPLFRILRNIFRAFVFVGDRDKKCSHMNVRVFPLPSLQLQHSFQRVNANGPCIRISHQSLTAASPVAFPRFGGAAQPPLWNWWEGACARLRLSVLQSHLQCGHRQSRFQRSP